MSDWVDEYHAAETAEFDGETSGLDPDWERLYFQD